jgi:hypothetical protein
VGTVQYSTSSQILRCTSGQRGSVACKNAIRNSSVATPGIPSGTLDFIKRSLMGITNSVIFTFLQQSPHLGFFLSKVSQAQYRAIYDTGRPKVPS